MADKAKEAAQMMQKGAARVVKARLSKRGQARIKQFCKQAQGLVDDVEVGKRSFPDSGVRTAMRQLIGSLEENLEAVAQIAEAVGDDTLVEIIEDAADSLAPADTGEAGEHENHGSEPHVEGLTEHETEEKPVDISLIDETSVGA